jgi:hypothetical protein
MGVILRMLNIKTEKKTNLKMYKVMAAAPLVIFGSEPWTLKERY